ncbi:hypothetical protein UA08_04981 [Talaromyces atroroseus]|uniref:ABC transporter domain-containing protein n=1 Tax=Talaromyces atroroseus TaxID=1441469 RepID=A0A225AEU2_TALAT|nr:hypothetical protein UA08_04981 [Talaromyces atroroseus]OKL59812.1 hypothetical protein UA08_04981 [Talaromyces atroroseus]
MERFKTPAGRLSTIFYSTDILRGKVNRNSSSVSDEKKSPVQGTDKEEAVVHGVQTKPRVTVKSVGRRMAGARGYDRSDGDVRSWEDTLAQRVSIGVVSGGMYLDNNPLPLSMHRRSGFVQQQDVHLSTSTVREALRLTAQLRRPSSVPIADKYDYVETVISMLEMGDVADALIGVLGAELSLEKGKRVSIGVELAAKPDILLFLDEPTSSLDGDSAFSIIQLMRKFADAGQTILCTIHQPSYELIELFDSLLLLIPGGKTAYFGPLGPKCETLNAYFSRHARRCEETENPADYVLDLTAHPPVDWAVTWERSEEYKPSRQRLEQILSQNNPGSNDNGNAEDDQNGTSYATSPLQQLRVVICRILLNYWRDPDYVMGKMQLNIWMGLINGLTFLQLSDSLPNSRNRLFSIFIAITGPVLTLQIEPRFIAFHDQFLAHEKESRVYHWSVFVLRYFTASERAGYAFLMYELYHIFVASLARLISSVFPIIAAAQVATGFVWLMVNTFNRPLSPPPLTPKGWR